jgi:nucleoside-diphosphate-sugar epimerase
MAKKKLLIIGGTGFLGENLVRFLKKKYNVFKTTYKKKKDFKILKLDLKNKTLIKNFFINNEFNYVINLGGYIDHSNLSQNGNEVLKVHLESLFYIFKFINKKKLEHFIQIGSSDEYGNNNSPQMENMSEDPFSIYSYAKAAATRFVMTLFKTEKFPVTVLRPFLVYGPGQNFNRFIPQVIKGCLNDKTFPTSAGLQYRDFCYIDDFAKSVIKLIGKKKTFGKIYNVGSGKKIRIRDAVNLIKRIIKKGKPQFGKFPYRKFENMSLYPSIKKIYLDTGWKPKVKLEEGLIKTIKYYRHFEK